MRFLPSSAALTAAVLTISSSASSAEVIDFATLPGTNGDAFGTYSQNGFTVASTSGPFEVGTFNGNPPRSIFALGVDNGASGDASILLTKDDAGAFSLGSFDFFPSGRCSYQLVGKLGASTVYDIGGSELGDAFVLLQPGTSGFVVDSVAMSFHGFGASYNVDNIVVSAVPEPATVGMLAMSAIGLAHRRARRAR